MRPPQSILSCRHFYVSIAHHTSGSNAFQIPGPKIDVTGPYLEGKDSVFPQMAVLDEREHARRTVALEAALKKEMAFELAFVRAGGLLLAGPDPTGNGGTLPGFGDQRGLQLLVEAGFTPVEAIRIATANGARFMGKLDRIGTIEPGKQADLVVIKGDPTRRIADVENVETVFKDGFGYGPVKLNASVRGMVGIR